MPDMRRARLAVACLALMLTCLLQSAFVRAADGSAAGGRFEFRQKVERKAGSRWTLQEWLAQKERNRLMDLWLAMYAPSPYEFFIGGTYNSFQTEIESTLSQSRHSSYRGSLGAYATIIGLQGSYENNTEERLNDLSGSLNLRVLGNAVQGTHLILHSGLRTRNFELSGVSHRLSNPFAGADLNLYLTRHFGVSGQYDVYFPCETAALGSVSGVRSEAGFFLDFEAVRVSGIWFSDLQRQTMADSTESISRTGVATGLTLFF